jgi:hypothetical protein
METKLTLTLDRSVIDSAKQYARSHRKSLSNLVEVFFRNLAGESALSEKYPPLIRKLSGVISEEDLNRLSEKDERVRYILSEDR